MTSLRQSQNQNTQNGESTNVAPWERLFSIGAGTMVFTRSLGRSLPGAILGAALAYRGVSGHCHLYDSLGVSTADGETGPGEVTVTRVVTIDAPPQQLYEFFVGQTNRFEEIMNPVTSVEKIDEDRYRFSIKGPLKNYESITRIHDRKEPDSFAWTTESGDVEHTGCVSFKESKRGTEVRVDIRYRVPGGELVAALARVTGMAPNETLERSLKQLKAKFETGEIPTIEGQPVGAGRGLLVREGATA
jgi:uncharacterized membrane protein